MKQTAVLLSLIALSTTYLFSAEPLTFEQRIQAQEAIERVYYEHRIWPKENPQPKPSFEEMVTLGVIEAKVTDYLKKSVALDEYWQRPVTADQLQAEMDRMVNQTKDPKMLQELFEALGNDPFIIAECLGRQSLSNHLIQNWYSFDDRFHNTTKQKAESAYQDISSGAKRAWPDAKYWKDTIVAKDGSFKINENNIARGETLTRSDLDRYKAVSKKLASKDTYFCVEETRGSFMVIKLSRTSSSEIVEETYTFRKRSYYDWWAEEREGISGNIKSTVDHNDEPYTLISSTRAAYQEGWASIYTGDLPFSYHINTPLPYTLWTGVEMIVGYGIDMYLYNPSTDSWQDYSFTDYDFDHGYTVAVWTGTVAIIWEDGGVVFDPIIFSEQDMDVGANAPSYRYNAKAVWSGSEMIVWGGRNGATYYNDGARYNLALDSWVHTSTGVNCPSARSGHFAAWTGNEMLIWGGAVGSSNFISGAKYDPISDTWQPISTDTYTPSPRAFHSCVWTGSDMIVWGGWDGTYSATGAIYNLSSDAWFPISLGPTGRREHTAVWTGTEMIIWGGRIGSGIYTNTGAKYNPTLDQWIETSTGYNCPEARIYHSSVWTGSEMIIWGGKGDNGDYYNNGGRYVLGSVCNPPSGLTNNNATDSDICLDSGVTISWQQDPSDWGDTGLGIRTYEVLRDEVALQSDIPYGTTQLMDTTGASNVQYSYTVIYHNGCGESSETLGALVADNVGPNASASNSGPYCEGDTIQLSGGPDGHTYSWTGPNSFSSYEQSPSILSITSANAGLYTMLLETVDGCTDSADTSVIVNDLPAVGAGVDVEACEDAGPFSLNGYSPTGGNWSGTGITDPVNGVFDPAISGVGNFILTYLYEDANGCSNSDTRTVTVHSLPIVYAGEDEGVCLNTPTYTLSGQTPPGGTWSGVGIVDPNLGTFSPSTAGEGSHLLTYTLTDVNSCTDSDTKIVTVHPLPAPTIAGLSVNTCPDNSVVLSTETGQLNYQWYKDSNPVPGAFYSTLTVSESGSYTVNYANSFGCSSFSAEHPVTIIPCLPDVYYFTHLSPTPVEEDGDGIMEAGEKWQLSVTLTNTGDGNAVNVVGSLQGEGLSVCNNPGTFGTIPIGGTGSCVFQFVVDPSFWYAGYSCGSTIGFDVVEKYSNSGVFLYPEDLNFHVQQVGDPVGIVAEELNAPDVWNISNDSVDSTFAPEASYTSTVYAELSYTLSGTTNQNDCVEIGIVDPNDTYTVLKAAGAPDRNPYDVTSFYTGPGTYSFRMSELTSCSPRFANVSASFIKLTVEEDLTNCNTGVSSCNFSVPEECAPGDTQSTALVWQSGLDEILSWPLLTGAEFYRVYRGVAADLPNLGTGDTDACLRYENIYTSVTDLTEDPELDGAGFYWYLVTGVNSIQEGSPGAGTTGIRALTSWGVCP